MGALTDISENALIDGLFRGGAINAAGALNSAAIVKGLWAASTVYAAGDIVVPVANTSAGGKFLRCKIGGTSGATFTAGLGNPGSTIVDNGVTWEVLSGMPSLQTLYVALFTAAPSDSGGGTEVTGGSYARVAVTCNLANWAGTQSAGSTAASTGSGGTTSNNGAITFPAPSANWGLITHIGLFDQATGGRLMDWAPLTSSKNVNNGDGAPSFGIGTLAFTIDN